jgi:hypothetical protein
MMFDEDGIKEESKWDIFWGDIKFGRNGRDR